MDGHCSRAGPGEMIWRLQSPPDTWSSDAHVLSIPTRAIPSRTRSAMPMLSNLSALPLLWLWRPTFLTPMPMMLIVRFHMCRRRNNNGQFQGHYENATLRDWGRREFRNHQQGRGCCCHVCGTSSTTTCTHIYIYVCVNVGCFSLRSFSVPFFVLRIHYDSSL